MEKSTAHPGAAREYLGVAEAATMTGTSSWFWRRKAYDGTVSSVKFGRRLLIPRAEIERFIRENTRPRAIQPSSEPGEAG